MPVHVISGRPVAYDGISNRIEARHMEIAYEQRPISVPDRRKEFIVFIDDKSIEQGQNKQHKHCAHAFFTTNTKDIEYRFHSTIPIC